MTIFLLEVSTVTVIKTAVTVIKTRTYFQLLALQTPPFPPPNDVP